METLLYVIFTVVCAALILLVLIQQGKGAGVGFSMGGASQAMFGGSGGRDFFIKLTSGLAVVFMVICIVLAKMAVSDAGAYHGAMAGAASAPGAPAAPAGVPMGNGSAPVAPISAQPLKAAPASAPDAPGPAAQSAPAPAPSNP
ncbi:MAG TPA: preprotein translocase subunit SecG [bacterium]|jgi:preprotein translocase subunit SecG|nr:preprotein translocase subunit SecG [bacterium]